MHMEFEKTTIEGLYVIKPDVHTDNRGSFFRTYCRDKFLKQKINFIPVQTNESYTKQKGTIRGLHFQSKPFEEAKLVRCANGKIFDVVVDLRKKSPTYSKWVSFLLSEGNHHMIYIPKGCAHGFQTLTDNCYVTYQMSEFYNSAYNTGIRWNDPTIHIQWPIKQTIVSQKDKNLPHFI